MVGAHERARVVIVTYCRKPELFYGTSLVFETLRTGFPNAQIEVIDNCSVPEVRSEIVRLADATDCDFFQMESQALHNTIIERIVMNVTGPVVFVDPDIMFWDSCEDWEINALVAGRLIPEFNDSYSGCVTAPRLHTSLLCVPDAERLRARIMAIQARYFEFQPFHPYMVKTSDGWQRYDVGASLYAALGPDAYAFQETELNAYDHLFCGSHLDWVAPKISDGHLLQESHSVAQEDYTQLRGLWKRQDEALANLTVL